MRGIKESECLKTPLEEGQRLEIAETSIPMDLAGECDMVVGLGNPTTKRMVWIPYGTELLVLDGKNLPTGSVIKTVTGMGYSTAGCQKEVWGLKRDKTNRLFDSPKNPLRFMPFFRKRITIFGDGFIPCLGIQLNDAKKALSPREATDLLLESIGSKVVVN